MHEMGALLGLPSASWSIAGKLPRAELGCGWCTRWDARGGGAPLHPGRRPELPKLPRLDPLSQKVFFEFGTKRRICPREGGKKLKLKKTKCFGLDGFTCLFWSVGLGKGSLWLCAINFCTVMSVNCNRLLLALSRDKCDFFYSCLFFNQPCVKPVHTSVIRDFLPFALNGISAASPKIDCTGLAFFQCQFFFLSAFLFFISAPPLGDSISLFSFFAC